MKVIGEIDRQKWSDFVYQHPEGNVFQIPEMYDVYKDASDTKPVLHCMVESDKIKALYLGEIVHNNNDFSRILTKRTVFYSGALAYDGYHFSYLIKSAINDSEGHFIEIRPRAAIDEQGLRAFGFKRKDHLNSLIHLTSLEDNWKKLERDKRKGINRSRNRYKIKVFEDNSYEGVEKSYDLLQKLYRTRKHPLRSKTYFHAVRKYLCHKGFAKYFLAYHNEEVIAFQLVLLYRNELLTYYTATNEEHKDKYAGDLLIWHLIEYGLRNGYHTLDFGGGGNPAKPYGPREYKKRFGTEFHNVGRWRYMRNKIFPLIEKVVSLFV